VKGHKLGYEIIKKLGNPSFISHLLIH